MTSELNKSIFLSIQNMSASPLYSTTKLSVTNPAHDMKIIRSQQLLLTMTYGNSGSHPEGDKSNRWQLGICLVSPIFVSIWTGDSWIHKKVSVFSEYWVDNQQWQRLFWISFILWVFQTSSLMMQLNNVNMWIRVNNIRDKILLLGSSSCIQLEKPMVSKQLITTESLCWKLKNSDVNL